MNNEKKTHTQKEKILIRSSTKKEKTLVEGVAGMRKKNRISNFRHRIFGAIVILLAFIILILVFPRIFQKRNPHFFLVSIVRL
jgi:hypothetical protein